MVAWMVTSSAVVGSSAIRKPGLQRQRHRQHDALAHAAGEFVDVAVEPLLRRGDADQRQQLDHALARLGLGEAEVGAQRVGDLVAHREHRVQRAHRLLEHHGDAPAAQGAHLGVALVEDVAALEQHAAARDLAGRVGDQAHDRLGRHRLAGTRFAHQAEGLAALDREGHAVDRREIAAAQVKAHREIVELENRLGHLSAPPAADRGCRAGRRRTG